MAEFVPVSEAKGRLTELVRTADDTDVVLTRHGRPAAVVLSARRHAELMELLDDLEDRVAVVESDDLTIPWEQLKAQLDLDEHSIDRRRSA